MDNRATLAILPFGMEVEIKRLSTVVSMNGATLSPEEESRQVADAVREIRADARWLLQSRLASSQQFRFVPLEMVDAAVADLQLKPGANLSADQLASLRTRLKADLLMIGTILDYGKVRWQWLAAGMLADMTWETVAIGLATAWNPGIILGNVGFELLTSPPVWFGGGYLFGVAFRPVRVQVWAIETASGEKVWSDEVVEVYIWKGLRGLPGWVRAKKEVQLRVNLAAAMERIADHFVAERITVEWLREQRRQRELGDPYDRMWSF